jgi:cytochrome c oxidase subunit 2
MHGFPLFHPQSPEARSIHELLLGVLGLCAFILLLVTGLIAFVCIKFRKKSDSAEPKPAYGNTKLETLWTALPFLTLVIVMFFTVRTMIAASPSDVEGKPDLIVIGHQWWWEVRYPREGLSDGVTANEVHIPAGKRLLLELRSADVIHDFWVPELGRKVDAIPGHPNQIWLEADQPGTYAGFCAEFCGASHAWMKIKVIAEKADDFQKWQDHEFQPAQFSKESAPQRGLALFQSRTCMNCHQVDGLSIPVQIGPDLTHVASRETLVAGALKNDSESLRQWLENPDRIKPGAHMPRFGFDKNEMDDLVSLLESLK